ncbi:MAG: hypothetical protein H7124_13025, partial [Phycisphaerales bacterium]|nr:hypothetical protein [Hyphomonadaceae bacterium]
RLRDALGAAAERPDLIGEAYPAAVALGAWSFTDQRYGDAVEAWAIAERTAEGANGDTAFARAYANIGIAASLIMDSAGARMRPREVERAATALAAAVSVYERHVSTGSAETLTPVQNAYAQALAWRAALSAKLRSDDMNVPPEIASNAVWEIGEPVDQRPACHLELAEHPRIRYPERMQNQSGVGSVIVHLRTDDVGVVTTRRVVAAVGASFARSVDDLESDWRMRRRESSPPGCRLATSYFTTVVFMLR